MQEVLTLIGALLVVFAITPFSLAMIEWFDGQWNEMVAWLMKRKEQATRGSHSEGENHK